jgi:hypothetical protein
MIEHRLHYTPQPGDDIEVRDARGEWLQKRACTTAIAGADFAVVWTCKRENWDQAKEEGLGSERTVSWETSVQFPWPAEDVRPATQTTPAGATIPIPERADVERDLKKLVQPKRSEPPR